jgi:hypothetical protein
MQLRNFVSDNGWFTMRLPNEWEEYVDGNEGTYAFFNAKSWTGNLRITPLRISNLDRDMAVDFLKSELEKNDGAKQIYLGEHRVVSYKKDILQDTGEFVNFYWITGKKNTVLVCSFTIEKNKDKTRENETELQLVENIISSIQIN